VAPRLRFGLVREPTAESIVFATVGPWPLLGSSKGEKDMHCDSKYVTDPILYQEPMCSQTWLKNRTGENGPAT
jgi:hypothetical protein